MIKAIAKLFIPKSATLAKYAADAIQKSMNTTLDGKEDTTSKYVQFATIATNTAQDICAMLQDGKIDDAERDKIAKALEPMMEKITSLL